MSESLVRDDHVRKMEFPFPRVLDFPFFVCEGMFMFRHRILIGESIFLLT
jgi:hypothetical protein